MRLVNNETMMLEEFMGSGRQSPKYAILSHTWGEEEVTFQDFTLPDKGMKFRKIGYRKIERTCQLAREAGLKYVWVDTCCIDKTSSAELTEAINSMFQWYMDAVVCYACLADLPAGGSLLPEDPNSCFKHCRWFTRGWTLQELIAPKELEFYDQEWIFRGTKGDLSDAISRITKIDGEVLQNSELLYRLPIAQRMSWASARQTTRVEDMAYCLLGIFDVNMPMLYGEGLKAFTRLQEEIMRERNDLSVFAWKAISLDQTHRGVLASTPSEFLHSASISLTNNTDFNPEFVMTNKGLRITSDCDSGRDGAYLMTLNCSQPDGRGGNQNIGIWVRMHGGGVYSRVKSNEFGVVSAREVEGTTKIRSLFISKRISSTLSATMEGSHRGAFMLRKGFNEQGVKIHDPNTPFVSGYIQPSDQWDSQRRMFLTHGSPKFTAFASFYTLDGSGGKFIVAFGKTDDNTEPWLTVDDHTGELTKCMLNLKKLGAIGSKCKKRHVTLEGHFGFPTVRVAVSLDKVVIDRQEVYCIDILYT
jgi:hypothetical protein